MAKITAGPTHKKPNTGIGKAKKLSTRVDLTPMVDLGFLLITFFIFTTTLSQPTAMKLVMPDDAGEAMPVKKRGALTFIPTGNETVYYYEGSLEEAHLKASTLKEIRDIIINKKKRTVSNDLFVIIKPSKTSAYGDIVSILDEMTINDVKKYAVVDITQQEENSITHTNVTN